ncbi:hypothetical protein L2V44_14175, partial [Staphylococcus aureus]|nr:hypothetical protein [Staphylococcus aureus]
PGATEIEALSLPEVSKERLGTTVSAKEDRGPVQRQTAEVPQAGTSTQSEDLVASGMQQMQTQLERFFQEVNIFLLSSECHSLLLVVMRGFDSTWEAWPNAPARPNSWKKSLSVQTRS